MRTWIIVTILLCCTVPLWADLNGSEISSVSGATGWSIQSTVSIGATTLVVSGGSGTPVVGDAFCTAATCLSGTNKAGHVVTAISGSGPYTLTVSPPMGYSWYVAGSTPTLSGETLTATTPVYFRATIGANAGACATASDKTTLAVGWITAHASDSRVIVARDSFIQPEFQGYDASNVTTHCVNLTHLFPSLANYISGGFIAPTYASVGSYGIFIGSHRPSGCVGNACDSTAFGPVAVTGVSSPGAGLQVLATQAVTTDPLAWDFYPSPQGQDEVYLGYSLRLQMLYVQKGGKVGFTTNSNYQMVMTGLTVDGSPCTMANPPTCGSSHITAGFLGSQWANGAYSCGIETKLTCLYDAGKTGYYLYGTTGFGYLSGLMPMIQVNTDSSTALGPHTIIVSLRPYDSVGTAVTAAQTYTINFTVLAIPSYPSITLQPASFPAIYNQGIFLGNSFWQGWEWCYGSGGTGMFNYLFPLGNQYFSAYFNQYSRQWNYDGLRNYTNMAQLVATAQASPVDWQAAHTYQYGDIITPSVGNAGGYSYIAINSANNASPGNSGISGGSHPTWPQTPTSGSTSAVQVADNTARWLLIGNYASWASCASNADYPWSAWVNSTNAASMDEPNQIGALGTLMNATATGDSQTNNVLVTPNRKALDYLASATNRLHVDTNYLDYFGARIEYYSLANYVADEMAGATHQVESSYLLDTLLNHANQIANCDETTWSVGSCMKAYYAGSTIESLTAYCEMQLSQGQVCDARIVVQVRAVLDKLWTIWNAPGSSCPLSGYTSNTTCAFPYAGNGEWPLTTANVNTGFVELNNLVCDGYAWLWSKVGDNWFLPDAVTTYRAAGDACFGHAYDTLGNYGNFGKEFNQNRAAWNYINWRNGTNVKTKVISATTYAYSPLNEWPENVQVVGAYADTVPPYHFWYGTAGSYPDTIPPAEPVTSSTADIWWNTYEQLATPQVCVSLSSSMTSPSCFTVGSSSQASVCGRAARTGTQMWNNCITVTGLTPSTTYYYTVGGTDLAGNVAKSQPGTGGVGPASVFSFATTAAPAFNQDSGGRVELGGKATH